MIARRVTMAIVLISLLFAAGCWFRGPGDVRKEVAQRTDLELDKQFSFQAGRPTLWLARQGLKIAGEADNIPLQGVRRVEVGIYEVRGPKHHTASYDRANSLCGARFGDWELLVRVCEPDGHVLMFTKIVKESIRGVLVVVQDEEEVVIVRAKGKLEKLLHRVMEMAEAEGGFLAKHRRQAEHPEVVDEDAPEQPLIAVCETLPADPGESVDEPTCADRDEARDAVLEIAQLLSGQDELFEAAP